VSEARRGLRARWPVWRAASHLAWWSGGLAPSGCFALLLCLIGYSPPDSLPEARWALLAGLFALGLNLFAVITWLQAPRHGGRELARSLLLALPLSYMPTLVGSLWVQDLPLRQLLVPKTLALWGTVYALLVLSTYLLRLKEAAFLSRLCGEEPASE
jgi:hypothetical protein